MELLKNLKSVRINSYKEIFLHLYGFILLSGIESDNRNWGIEKRSELQRKKLALLWLHALK